MGDEDLLVSELSRWIEPAAVAPYFLDLPAPVVLDSSAVGGRLGRYSYLSAAPSVLLQGTVGALILRRDAGGTQLVEDAEPWRAIARLLAPYQHTPHPGLPPFQGGALGYVGYEMGRPLARLGPRHAHAEALLPDLSLGFYDWVLARDHALGRSWLLVHVAAAGGMAAARRRLAWVRERLPTAPGSLPPPALHEAGPRPTVQSTFSRAGYLAAVLRAREYIAAGDIYQVNLSQRLEVRGPGVVDPWSTFLRLRAQGPVPFGAYMGLDHQTALVCGSPELFVRLDGDGRVETRPMKGTRPRGADPTADAVLAQDLRTSEKDRAENLMIVDLLRNDLGRVCRTGSVTVPALWQVESYATVHQLVSCVTGLLCPEHDAVDLLQACLGSGNDSYVGQPFDNNTLNPLSSLRQPQCGGMHWT